MRKFPFALVAAVALFLPLACVSQAAEKPRPAQADQSQPKKVWTNDDMDQLRSQGLITTFNQEAAPTAAPAPTTEASVEVTFPIYESRLDDPTWYADKAAQLQAQLDKSVEALRQEQQALADAKDRVTQPGVAMNEPSIGVTPAGALEDFEAQVQEAQNQLDELSDLARQHNIEPGVLRS